ncbi:carboxylesterase/lipase family protein [Novosphingobium beihaiensis]|uniref:Carboxylic ester hydrolase n=1 Tax=Novosphingobium beihaiensis TaxID=2930389 RepID=A0ABT0BRK2_9SPHN|nr:carboxylesterase family protein [Novosphingobium beihaiensis]MCJ2187687.1 carboxylesterase family protein [Novosphingobium beihaiensis]
MKAVFGTRRTRSHRGLRLVALAAVLAMAGPAMSDTGADAPVVTVTGGAIRGKTVDGALVFQAIPFAAPPLGERRWQPPAPVPAWQGVREATKAGPACLQNDEGWNRADWLHASEDCLTLNVRTPALAGKRPVMVWIHGGSNRAGSAMGAVQSPMSRKGVVIVSVQYRLGILGFLSHRALAREQGGTSGNYGLMDQIAALRWVHENIARFGGDPDKVTIFGESAGSQDVSLLLAAPAAQGLFRSAIMESGTPGFGLPFRSLADAFALGDQLDTLSGSGGDIEKLRALSPVALLALQSKLDDPRAKGNDYVFLRTTIDGKVLPKAPDVLLGEAKPKPVIIGTNMIEFGPGKGEAPLDAFSRFWFDGNGPKALAAYQEEERKGADPRRGNLELRMQSDAMFHCPANRMANLLAAKGWPVWRYEFDVGDKSQGGLTRHAYEVGYVFDGKPVGGGVSMLDYWTALAIDGDPNAKTRTSAPRPLWKPLAKGKTFTLHFGETATKLSKGLPRSSFCNWTGVF